jgi:outer membrane protein assembly factor BamC
MSRRFLPVLIALTAVGGCAKLSSKLDGVIPDNRTEYRKSRSMPDLEVPPGLTTDAIRDRMAIPEGGAEATFSTYQERIAKRTREQELARSANDAIKVLEDEHILAVEGAPKQIWPELQRFMTESKYDLDLDDEELGVIETVWDEDPEALTRYKFKIFAEAGEEAGTTLLYVSQKAEEIGGDGDWIPRDRDAMQEREFVERLQAFLVGQRGGARPEDLTVAEAYGAAATGAAAAAAAAPEGAADAAGAAEDSGLASIVSAGGGKIYLAVAQELSLAWRPVGEAIERAGYTIDQSDKSRGLYYLRVPASEGEAAKRGLLNKMKFWGDDEEHELQLNLTGVGVKTEVVVLDREGRWETGEIARKVLERLERELEAAGS